MDMADREPEQRHISPEELQRAQAAIRMLSAIPMGPSFSDAASDSRSRSGVSAGDSRSRSDAAAGDFTCRSSSGSGVAAGGSTSRSDASASDGGSTLRNGAGSSTTSTQPGPSSGKIMQGVSHTTEDCI